MNYLISKKENDGRITLCGVIIPDNFFVVVGLTFENQRQLKQVGKRYNVTETKLPEGHYDPNGRRVDKWSIRDWAYDHGKLIYLDGEPEEELAAMMRDVRPPDVSQRPEHIDLDDIASETLVALPPAVKLAQERIAKEQEEGKEAVAAPDRKSAGSAEDTEIPLEDDMTTLTEGGGTDEVKMLRAALDVRGVKYSPQAKAPALRKKLDEAQA